MTLHSSILHTKRLRLEPLEPRHADLLFAQLQDRRIYDFIGDAPPTGRDALRERYARLALGRSPDDTERWLNWVIWCVKTECHIGYVQATIPDSKIPSIAYVLSPIAWGKGYAGEAVARMIEHLFDAYRPAYLRATVDVRNERSIRLLERLGFSRLTVRKKAEQIRGVWTDEAEYRAELPLIFDGSND